MADHRPDNTPPRYVTHAEAVVVTADSTAVVNPSKTEGPPRPARVTVEGAATVSRSEDGAVVVRFDNPQEA